ncbi:hypothetical protein QBC46DRAFT_396814 [Diplogelasinospora grovesii]|uniref:Uncharacterized protein n=1 Tax=Diplogelasinospora grovesii TaxID=303347 RepID=A0AAN6MY82_9PEZI|nr:hypothetical protein QBC46DRAFT_396814 [Diplogelasinospora grovesii]
MASSKQTNEATSVFTQREQELIANAMLCMRELPNIDYNKLAERMGMQNVRSASNAWSALKKKLLVDQADTDGSNGKRKAAQNEDGSGGEDKDNKDDEAARPAKRGRGRPPKPAAAAKKAATPESSPEKLVIKKPAVMSAPKGARAKATKAAGAAGAAGKRGKKGGVKSEAVIDKEEDTDDAMSAIPEFNSNETKSADEDASSQLQREAAGVDTDSC